MFFTLICHCIHNQMSMDYNPKEIYFPHSKRTVLGADRQKIRVVIDTSLIGSGKDKNECKEEGTKIYWNGNTYTCSKYDILTEEKINVIKGTMKNVERYFTNLLYVDPLQDGYDVDFAPYFFKDDMEPIHVSNVDLYILCVVRPYENSNILASAICRDLDGYSKRPISGYIFVNPADIPDQVEDYDSWSSKFFMVCLHELFHVVGISSNSFSHFHPRCTNKPHEQIFCELNNPLGKKHSFIVTPFAHQFAVQQWGVEIFSNGTHTCPSGIELEDAGGSGTRGSHPDGKIALTDLMCGLTLQSNNGPFNRVTQLTMALLLDFGVYDVDYHYVQPLIWGSPAASRDGKPINGFVMEPPDKIMPPHAIYRSYHDPETSYPLFNYKGFGSISQVDTTYSSWNCTNPSHKSSNAKLYCSGEKFYNHHGERKISYYGEYDFQKIANPNTICKDGEAVIPGYSMCFKYTISSDKKTVTFKIPNNNGVVTDFVCNEANEEKNTTLIHNNYHFKVMCPPIQQFIRLVTIYEKEKFYTSNPFTTIEPTGFIPPKRTPKATNADSQEQNHGLTIVHFSIFAVIGLVIIIIILSFVVFCIHKKKAQESSDEEDILKVQITV